MSSIVHFRAELLDIKRTTAHEHNSGDINVELRCMLDDFIDAAMNIFDEKKLIFLNINYHSIC